MFPQSLGAPANTWSIELSYSSARAVQNNLELVLAVLYTYLILNSPDPNSFAYGQVEIPATGKHREYCRPGRYEIESLTSPVDAEIPALIADDDRAAILPTRGFEVQMNH